MRRLNLALVLLAVLVVAPQGQESITLTVPVVKTNTTSCALETFAIRLDTPFANSAIQVTLVCTNAERISKEYSGSTTPTGASLLTTLNKANMSGANPSLIRLVYTRLIADGVVAGTVVGTPQ